jgi:hypothetical protein
VIEAIADMWQYMDAIRLAANQTCMTALAASVKTFDTILEKNNTADTQALKSMFGLEGVKHTDDFATSISVRNIPSHNGVAQPDSPNC